MREAIDLTPDLAGLTATLVYLVVFGFVFVESGLLIGFLLPGDSLLFAAGLVSATEGSGVSLTVLVIGVLVAAVAGDSVGYAFGARLGRPWLERRAAGGRLDARHLRRAEAFYERFGWFAVVAARWIPWVRTFTPVLAGAARMPYRRFLPANIVGAVIWGWPAGDRPPRGDRADAAAHVVRRGRRVCRRFAGACCDRRGAAAQVACLGAAAPLGHRAPAVLVGPGADHQ